MSLDRVRRTSAMTRDEFAKHVNARHLESGYMYSDHFRLIRGLETMWRAWHMADHRDHQAELDHIHSR